MDAVSLGLGSCAVVTNSGALLRHEYGAEIDAHDHVIRFNWAPTSGFEKWVGHKTTILGGSAHILQHSYMRPNLYTYVQHVVTARE